MTFFFFVHGNFSSESETVLHADQEFTITRLSNSWTNSIVLWDNPEAWRFKPNVLISNLLLPLFCYTWPSFNLYCWRIAVKLGSLCYCFSFYIMSSAYWKKIQKIFSPYNIKIILLYRNLCWVEPNTEENMTKNISSIAGVTKICRWE